MLKPSLKAVFLLAQTPLHLGKVSPASTDQALEEAGIDNSSYDHLTPWQAFWTVGWMGAQADLEWIVFYMTRRTACPQTAPAHVTFQAVCPLCRPCWFQVRRLADVQCSSGALCWMPALPMPPLFRTLYCASSEQADSIPERTHTFNDSL